MRRLGVASALASVAILGVFAIASAHVTLVRSEPAAGSRLDAAPTRIRLQFSETLDASLAKVWIDGADGAQVPLTVTSDPSNAYTLLAAPSSIVAGTYRIVWRVVSDDGHAVTGSFSFTVGAGEQKPPDVPLTIPHTEQPALAFADVPLLPAILRGLGVGALAALTGLLFFSLRAPSTLPQQRVTMWLAAAAPVFLTAHLIAWLWHTAPDHRLTSEWMGSVFGSTVGRVELWRSISALLPIWALLLARRRGLAFGLAIPALLLSSAIGHSAAIQPTLSIPLKAVHLIALALWLGGLLWLSTHDRTDVPSFTRAGLRVSSVALVGVIAIVASGIAQSLLILPSISSVWSAYGGVLAAKVAGLLMLVGFGAYHRFRALPRLARELSATPAQIFAISLRREIVLLWLVVVLGGLLAYVPPPTL